MKKITILFILFTIVGKAFGQQKIGNNPTSLNSNAILELESTNKGLLIPRIALSSTSSASPLSTHVAGMLVYNTATAGDVTPGFYVSTGSSWSKIDNQSSTTLYNGDGTISGNRTVTQGANTLAFTSTSTNGFSIDGTTFSVDAANNRIGIGNSAPISTLSVSGRGVFGSNLTTNNDSNDDIYLEKNGDYSQMHLFNTDLLNTDINAYISLNRTGSSNGSGNANPGLNVWTSSSHPIRFSTNALERIVITSAGNVGIGNPSPSEKLDVSGNVRFSGALMPNNLSGTSGQVLTSAGAGAAPTWTTVAISNLYSADGTLEGNRTITQGTNVLAFTSSASSGTSHFTVDGTTLNVDAVNNRIGVGIATPTFPLHVATSGANAGRFEMNSTNSSVGGISTIELINTNNLIGNYTSIAGKASSGGFSASMEFVNTNGSHLSPIGDIRFVTNNNGTITEKLRILGNGGIRASSLAGSGSRMVVADASGNLSTQTIPTSTTYTGSTSVTLNGTSFERAALTGDVTATANGNATTIATDAVTSAKILNGTIAEADVANDAISYAKLQNITTNNRLLGRGTTGAGDAEEITVGSGLTLTGTTLTATGASTLYSADGTLAGNRTVTQGTNTLAFTSTSTTGTSHFTVDGTTLNVNAVNNRIGLGIAAPIDLLHLEAQGGRKIVISNNGGITNNEDIGGITWRDDNGTGTLMGNIIVQGNSGSTGDGSSRMVIGTRTNDNSTTLVETMTIHSNGNVGLGTTILPTEKLHVTGNIRFSGALMPNNTAGTSGQVLTSAGAGNVPTWTTLPTATTYSGSTSVTLNGTSFERAALTGDITATANSNATTIATDAVTSAKILNGTIAEADVANDAISYTKLQNITTNNRLLGRGTTGAGDAEEITIGSGLTLTGTTLTASGGSTLYSADGTLSGNRTVTQGTNTLSFTSSATNGFSVDGSTFSVDAANNRVGIGTTSPRGALDVGGTTGWTYLQNSSYLVGNPTIARGLMYAWNNTGSNGEHELLFGTGEGSAPSFNISTWNGTTKTPRFVITKDGDFSLDGSTLSVNAANDRVGVGTSSPTQKLDVDGGILARGNNAVSNQGAYLQWNRSSSEGETWLLNQKGAGGSNAGIRFGSVTTSNVATEWARFLDNGNFGIGNTNPTGKLDVSGGKIKMDINQTLTIAPTDNFTYDSKSMSHYGIGWFNDSWNGSGSTAWLSGYGGVKLFASGGLVMSVDNGGTCRNSSGSWTAFSDARVKTVKSEFKDGLNVIKQINPVRFVYNENAPFKTNDVQIGIVAQDLEKVAPYMVTKTNNGEIQDLREVNTQAYVFLLINAVKEQQAQIEEMKKEIEELKKDKK